MVKYFYSFLLFVFFLSKLFGQSGECLNYALKFNGSHDFIQFTTKFPFHEPGDITIEFWFQPFIQTRMPIIYGAYDINQELYSNRYNIFYDNGSQRIINEYRDSTPKNPSNTNLHNLGYTSQITTGEWSHIAIARSGNVYRVYTNGILETEVTDLSPNLPTSLGWSLSTNWMAIDGLLDELRIYNKARSATEIQFDMFKALVGNEPALVGYWDFNEGSGNIIYDKTASAVNGKLGGYGPDASAYSPDYILSGVPIMKTTNVVTHAILGGAYSALTDTMSTNLNVLGLLPTRCPYDTSVSLDCIPATMVDWVRLELVDTLTGDSIYASQCACLLKTGEIKNIYNLNTLVFCGVSNPKISLRINHRNHLSVRSLSLNNTSCASSISFDFRLGQNLYVDPTVTGSSFNNVNMPEVLIPTGGNHPSRFTLWPGDANGDGQIKYQGSGNDRGLILSAIGGTDITNTLSGYLPTDINLNGQVKYQGSGNDRGIVLSSIGGSVITKVTKAHD